MVVGGGSMMGLWNVSTSGEQTFCYTPPPPTFIFKIFFLPGNPPPLYFAYLVTVSAWLLFYRMTSHLFFYSVNVPASLYLPNPLHLFLVHYIFIHISFPTPKLLFYLFLPSDLPPLFILPEIGRAHV